MSQRKLLYDSNQRKQTGGVITLEIIFLLFEDARHNALPHIHTYIRTQAHSFSSLFLPLLRSLAAL